MEKHAIHGRLLRDGWPEVLSIVSRREQETVDLDFKSKADPTHGALDRKDREILAQTLSAEQVAAWENRGVVHRDVWN